ncbi:MAG: hypothetical protein ACI8UP_003444 [Porticoccaceae bacterium]|jgi:hypothetical protein
MIDILVEKGVIDREELDVAIEAKQAIWLEHIERKS